MVEESEGYTSKHQTYTLALPFKAQVSQRKLTWAPQEPTYLGDTVCGVVANTSPKRRHVKPGQQVSVPALGQYNDKVGISVDEGDIVELPDWPHSWEPTGKTITKDVFGFTMSEEYFHLALGVPTLFQLIFRFEKKGGYTFKDTASLVVEVDASEVMDSVVTGFSGTRTGVATGVNVVNYVFGLLKPVIKDRRLYVGVHLDFNSVMDGNSLLAHLTVYMQQMSSFLLTTLSLEEEEYGPLTLKEYLRRGRRELRSVWGGNRDSHVGGSVLSLEIGSDMGSFEMLGES